MRKFITISVIVILLSTSITPVYTDDEIYFLNDAYILKDLGLFVGTNNGFELNRPPTRIEGVVILLRLIGKVDKAINGHFSHPFDDVPEWADNFVGYAYQNKLIYGVGNNKYDSLSNMTREQFITVVLRALGYDDTQGDFYWESSVKKGIEIGLIEEGVIKKLLQREFLRDEVVYILKRSLDINHKTLEKPLKEILYENDRYTYKSISLGDSKDKIIIKLGEPNRIDLSKYGFDWYIYNNNYENYIQIGIKNNKVVAVYSNSINFKLSDEIKIGSSRLKVRSIFGNNLEYLLKGNTKYYLSNGNEYDIFQDGNKYIYAFYDLLNNDMLTAVLIIDKDIEENFKGFYGEPSEELRLSYERQILDLTNSIRVRFGKKIVSWDELARKSARSHSKDMAMNNYFDHININGETPFDRMEKIGIEYNYAGENIAAGQTSAIFAHEGWMNSEGHRNNILFDNFDKLGVGVYFGGEMKVYYTQNFYK